MAYFRPNTNRGLLLQEMKHALTKLRQTPPEERLSGVRLDLFERSWFLEFKATDKACLSDFEHSQGLGTNVEFTDILRELPRHMSEELNLTVCLKWAARQQTASKLQAGRLEGWKAGGLLEGWKVRFLLHYYCGGIKVVQLSDVVRTRLSRLHCILTQKKTLMRRTACPPPVHSNVLIEAGWIDAFLGPLPDEGAMERLDRGVGAAPNLTPQATASVASSWLMVQDGEGCALAGVEAARKVFWQVLTRFALRPLKYVECEDDVSNFRGWKIVLQAAVLDAMLARFLDLRLTVDDAVAGCGEVLAKGMALFELSARTILSQNVFRFLWSGPFAARTAERWVRECTGTKQGAARMIVLSKDELTGVAVEEAILISFDVCFDKPAVSWPFDGRGLCITGVVDIFGVDTDVDS
ncbi:hypothetical protein AK812_SmicGene2513 [Symbiodinium microadriaticum]|uniref:Uncharacterized protein n=1 Tax=Symbiodinium microadriaticum TaxID=2951 RepID=A0A1Q9F1C9_SYMMI|nr:hypothetical protein AK812_SmicGene2513 [Symbiodinium microadriaticum]